MGKSAPVMRVEGLPQVRRALRNIQGNVDDLKDANAAVAALVAHAAAPRAPRRTGRLASSVRGNRSAGRATVSAGGATLPYAGPIHWGWPSRHIDGQPFIVDTALATEPVWLPMYERNVQDAVDKTTALAHP